MCTLAVEEQVVVGFRACIVLYTGETVVSVPPQTVLTDLVE